jgi:hypothetical protein
MQTDYCRCPYALAPKKGQKFRNARPFNPA